MRTDGRDGRHDLTQLQLVQNGGLAGGIETNHQNALLGLAEHTLPHTTERKSHFRCQNPRGEKTTSATTAPHQPRAREGALSTPPVAPPPPIAYKTVFTTR